MKHLYLILCGLMIAGCAEIGLETGSETAREALQPMTFSASFLEEPEFKAAVDGLDIKWSAGDAVGIYDGTAFRKFDLREGAGTTSAVFSGNAASADSYIAVYPYSEGLAVDSEGNVSGLSIPSVQTAGECPVIMTARCDGDSNALEFRNALAYVKFTPGFDCHKIVFETYGASLSGRDLCGDVKVATGTEADISASIVGNAGSHVVLSGDIKADSTYCIGASPVLLSKGFTIVFDALSNELQYISKKATCSDGTFVRLVRGHVLNLGTFAMDSEKWTETEAQLGPWGPFDTEGDALDYRSVYDCKDVMRIREQIQKSGDTRQLQIHFMEDIDFGGSRINPQILNSNRFINIDGHGHRIFNYVQGSVDDDGCRYAGLFYVKNVRGITFECLSLYPEKFDMSHDNNICAGAFVAACHCSGRLVFKDCRVSGEVSVKCTGTTSEAFAGGFCGKVVCVGTDKGDWPPVQTSVDVSDCLMDGMVTAYSEDDMAYAGGFIALMEAPEKAFECSIRRCRNRAAILAQGDDDFSAISFNQGGISAGGMIGCDRDISTGGDMVLTLNSCVNEGVVQAHAMDNDNAFAGGMVGCHDSDGLDYEDSQFHEKHEACPAVNNCLNRGTIIVKGGTGMLGAMAGLAGGMVGYSYSDRTRFSNCVDNGSLSSDDICAHICGTDGTYDDDKDYPCLWTTSDSHFGIHEKEDRDIYSPGRSSGRKTDLKPSDMKGDFYRDYEPWIMRGEHIDLDIVY